jgi:hypothetical protein
MGTGSNRREWRDLVVVFSDWHLCNLLPVHYFERLTAHSAPSGTRQFASIHDFFGLLDAIAAEKRAAPPERSGTRAAPFEVLPLEMGLPAWQGWGIGRFRGPGLRRRCLFAFLFPPRKGLAAYLISPFPPSFMQPFYPWSSSPWIGAPNNTSRLL